MAGAARGTGTTGRRVLAATLLLAAALAQGLHALAGQFTVTTLLLGLPALWLLAESRAHGRRRRGALRLAGAVVLALGAGELVLRATWGDEGATIYELDDELLHRLVPGSRRVVRRSASNGGDRIVVAVNRDGFRGDELADDGARRIAVFGDSFVAAEGSRLPDTFVARLQAELQEMLGEPVETVNAGVIGYGPDQSLLRMAADVPRLQPELVVFTLYAGNDWGDLVRNQLFVLDEHGALQRRRPPLAAAVRAEFLLARHEPRVLKRLDLAARRLWRKLAWQVGRLQGGSAAPTGTSEGFVPRCLAQAHEDHRRHVVEGDGTVRRLLGDAYDADLATDPSSPSAEHKRRLMGALLERVRDEAERLSVPLLLVVVPSPIDACDEHDLGQVDPARHPAYARDTLTSTLVALAGTAGLPCVDLFPIFRAHPACDLYLRGNDDHWNDLGQAVAAQHVAQQVLAQGLLARVHER